MSVPFKVDLNGRVAVVTGGGGVLCSAFAKALAECGAAVAVADLKLDAAQKTADAITASGGKAIAIACNVLDKASLEAANAEVEAKLGSVDILLNGAGGNHPGRPPPPRSTLDPEDIKNTKRDFITFYDLDPKGVEFVPNFLGTLLPTQAFTKKMAAARKGVNPQRLVHERVPPAHEDSRLQRGQGRREQLHAVDGGASGEGRHPRQRDRAGLLPDGAEQDIAPHEPDGSYTARSHKILATHLDGTLRRAGRPHRRAPWLVSDQAAGFVTGVVVPIDGGFAAYSGVCEPYTRSPQ